MGMLFEALRSERGCMSYLVACEAASRAAIIDPCLDLLERYRSIASQGGLQIDFVIETHTHADHFTAVRELARHFGARIVMYRSTSTRFVDLRVDDGDLLRVGTVRMRVLHTPGHTEDSMSLVLDDRVLTGDALLLGGCGRTDLPGGDASTLYESLFERLLNLDENLLVFPGHNYKQKPPTTLKEQRETNPRLQVEGKEAFTRMMGELNLSMPDHLTEALRVNRSGGKSVQQLIDEAARQIAFMGQAEVKRRLNEEEDIVVLDVREPEAFASGHIEGAVNLPRGMLELRADSLLPNPSLRIVVYCQFGKISTLAAATLRDMGFEAAVALDGGFDTWNA